MANRIRGITIEINGDTSKLSQSLSALDKKLKQSATSLKDINKLLKLDPGNVTILKQKYAELGKSVDDTKQRLERLKEAQRQMESAGKTDTAEYDKLQREIVETEQNLKSLTKEYERFGSVSAQQIAAAGEKMKQFGGKKGKKILSDVESIFCTSTGETYASNEDTLFVSTGAKKLKKLMELD